jgi:hypothetical protein
MHGKNLQSQRIKTNKIEPLDLQNKLFVILN